MLCSVPGADTAFRAGLGKVHIDASQHTEGWTPKVMLDSMFFTSDQEPGVQLLVLLVYDLSTGEVMAMQSTTDSSGGSSCCCGADSGSVETH